MDLTVDQKYTLITRNLAEAVIDEPIAKKIMEKRPLKIYWGTSPTSMPHIGYIVPVLKIIDFIKAGCEVTILLADLHALLDHTKTTFDKIEARTQCYQVLIQELLKIFGVDLNLIRFVRGTSFQLSEKYTMDVYKTHTLVSIHEAKHAGAEVVKQSDNPKLTGLLYPTLQALDEEYLGVDCQFGGVDQRKIFMHAHKLLPSIGYKKRFHLMNKMVPGLRFEKISTQTNPVVSNKQDLIRQILDSGSDDWADQVQKILDSDQLSQSIEKMSSSSQADSKITLLDTPNQIKKKINRVYCLPGDVDDNSLIPLLENVVFPCLELTNSDLVINRKEEYGGSIVYKDLETLVSDFTNQVLHPSDLKQGIVEWLGNFLKPMREHFENKELKKLVGKAFN